MKDASRLLYNTFEIPGTYSTIGLHPLQADKAVHFDENHDTLESYFGEIEEYIERTTAKDPCKIAAIGPCGLNFMLIERAKKESQVEAFERHFDLAEKFKLPMHF